MQKRINAQATKAVIFARVSSKEQEDGHSLDAQINKGIEYAQSQGLEIFKTFRIIESSTIGKRPQFAAMVNYLKSLKEKVILIAHNPDRLQRKHDIPSIELLGLVESGKIEIWFSSNKTKLSFNTNDSDEVRYDIEVAFAKNFVRKISANVMRSNEEKRSKGAIGHDSPLGYLNLFRNKETHKDPVVEIDEKRAPFVIKAFEMYASGAYSVRDIVKILGKEGFTQKKGGKPVTVANITSMLTNRFYYGEIESYKYDMIFPHVYPTLINKELFDKCQKVRLSRGRALGKAREEAELEEFKTIADQTTNTTFIFKGTTRCKECNCIYSPKLKTKRVIKPELKSKRGIPKDKSSDDFYFTQKYTYLRPLKKGNGCKVCEHIREDCIEAQVINAMEQIHIPEDLIKSLKPDIEKELSKNTNYHKTRLSITEEKLAKLKSQKENLLQIRLDGEITAEIFKEKDRAFTENITALEKELEGLKVSSMKQDSIIDIFKIASKISDIYKSSGKSKKREIIKTLFTNFLLSGKNLYIYWKKPFNLLMEKEVK